MANMNQKQQAQEKTSTNRTSGSEKGTPSRNMGNKKSEDVQKDRSERFTDDESGAV